MKKNSIFEFCKDSTQDSLSIWQIPKEKKRPIFIAQQLSTMPRFDSNSTYIIIQQRHNISILNDAGFNSFKIFFWVGSRSGDYENYFQETILIVNDIIHHIPLSKVRLFVEFQYSESFQFFSLFKRNDLRIARVQEICAIQYQDYFKKTRFYRAIPFPKIMIFELINFQQEYQKYNIRVYEKSEIESKIQSSLVYFKLEGKYIRLSDNKVFEPNAKELDTKDELFEEVEKIEVLFGSRVNFVLRQFAKKVLIDFQRNYKDIQINDTQQKGESLSEFWQQVEDKAQFLNSEVDKQWSSEEVQLQSAKFQYPYQITNWDWKKKDNKKDFQQFSDDTNVIYEIENEYKVLFQKKEIDFDPRNISLFRVSFQTTDGQMLHRMEILDSGSKPSKFKQDYHLSFQQLKIEQTENSMLGNSQIYLIYTPFSLFLWVGSEVDVNKRVGGLSILKSFLTMHLEEQINYTPSYLQKNQNLKCLKFRIENQNYESQRFRALFKKNWSEDKLDYVMMRRPKLYNMNDHMKNQAAEDLKQSNLDHDYMEEMKANHHGNIEERKLMKKKTFEKESIQGPLAQIRANPLAQSQIKGIKGLDVQQHRFDQEKYIEIVNANFAPLNILSTQDQSKNSKIRPQSMSYKKEEFDQITVFEIRGNIFEALDRNFEYAVFDKGKAYFIVFTKYCYGSKIQMRHAIYLWRGNERNQQLGVNIQKVHHDQKQLSLLIAVNRFQETEFRSIQIQHGRRSSVTSSQQSIIRNFTQMTLTEEDKSDDEEVKNEDDFVMHTKMIERTGTIAQSQMKTNKFILTPSAVTQFTSQDKLDKQKIINMKPIIDLDRSVVNMRAIIKQDCESQHFLSAFEGTVVIKTNSYLERQFIDDLEIVQDYNGLNYVMVFQLIGVPTLNQKAREVPPKYSSFTTTGLYILLTKFQVHYWIGQEYYNDYLDENRFNKQDSLISNSLQSKLYDVYEKACDGPIIEQRTVYNLESREDKTFFKIIGFQMEDWENFDQRDVLKFESKFLKNLLIPQEPRLYCLVINGNIVDYDEEIVSKFSNEKIVIINKEIHSFNQQSLHNKGVFLLDFYSEAFVWIGKKVKDADRLYVLQLAYSALKVLHNDEQHIEKMCITQVDSGYEPEIFRQAFKDGWVNYDHDPDIELEDTEEDQPPDFNQEIKSPRRLTQLDTSFKELLPEQSIWFT